MNTNDTNGVSGGAGSVLPGIGKQPENESGNQEGRKGGGEGVEALGECEIVRL